MSCSLSDLEQVCNRALRDLSGAISVTQNSINPGKNLFFDRSISRRSHSANMRAVSSVNDVQRKALQINSIINILRIAGYVLSPISTLVDGDDIIRAENIGKIFPGELFGVFANTNFNNTNTDAGVLKELHQAKNGIQSILLQAGSVQQQVVMLA